MGSMAKSLEDRVQEKLANLLVEGSDDHRCAAAAALGVIARPRSANILCTALHDENEDVRTAVARALSNQADPAIADAIMEIFVNDPCSQVKLATIEMLAKVGHKPLVPHLLTLVRQQDEELVWDEDEFYHSSWEDWCDLQLAAIRVLGLMGIEEAVPQIVEVMADHPDQNLSNTAIAALVNLGDDGLDALADIHIDGDSSLRREICAALLPGASAAVDRLLDQCLNDADAQVREAALERLLQYAPGDARLVGFIDDPSPEIRVEIIRKIGQHHPDDTMAKLLDSEAMVRKVAFRCVADNPALFEQKGFSKIVAGAISGNPQVAGDAAVAWASLVGKATAGSLGKALQNTSQPQSFRLGLVEALARLDDAGFPFLAKAAGDENVQVRTDALAAIAALAKKSSWPNAAGEALLAALNGDLIMDDKKLKAAPHQDIKRHVAKHLGEFPHEDVTSALATTLITDDVELKTALLGALDCIGEVAGFLPDEVSRSILAQCHNANSDIRRLIARCLTRVGSEEALDAFEVLAVDTNAPVRHQAIRSLGQKNAHRNIIVGALNDDNSGVRTAAAMALAADPDAHTVKQLVALSLGYNGMHCHELCKLLRTVDPQTASRLYLKVLNDEASKRVWRVAIEALGELQHNLQRDDTANLAA